MKKIYCILIGIGVFALSTGLTGQAGLIVAGLGSVLMLFPFCMFLFGKAFVKSVDYDQSEEEE